MKGPSMPGVDGATEKSLNERFRQEVERYHLVYRCSDCVHCDVETLRCTLGYPNEMLAKGEVRGLWDGGKFVFCKDFELD